MNVHKEREFSMKIQNVLAVFCVFGAICMTGIAQGADDKFLSCGVGYVLTSHSKIDGINAAECQKLWCRDLENGKSMGNAKSPASGYQNTSAPVQLCDADNNCIECFGDRKWCSGEVTGRWNPEYGAYTRNGADNGTYVSYQKGGCYAWRLEKPNCPSGQTAILQGGQWVCALPTSVSTGADRGSSLRRTGTMRRIR